ncbi:MAG: helix-turn-helix domain-containing protein [Chloroflexi bacterium]|nr:helix-turn-helix domain-containing protein [Chloroflexota bacterium]
MPAAKRQRVEPTDDWHQLQLLADWPEQIAYELIRPVVLFGRSPAERAEETGSAARTIHRKADRFDAHGMPSLFADFRPPKETDRRSLPPHLRQLIVDRKAEYPAFTPHELATLCYVASGRRPSSHTVKRVLATGPKPTSLSRRYPRYAQMEPADRRLAIIRLHAEGWTVTSIAAYLGTNRPRVYETLRRWVEEGVQGLEDKPHIPRTPRRKVDLEAINAVRKLQENPELGEFRIHAALLQLGIKLSPRTCGRILALNRSLYGLDKPKKAPHDPKPMPFQAERRHQYWTVDVRYLDMHRLGGGMVYVITILENFSRAILASAVSRNQDLTAYLMVLYAAIRQHGCPEALVSDSGSIFRAKEALRIYTALGIRKEQIDKKQAWQSYIETHFNVQRRMADWHVAKAETWEELVAAHERFVADYNHQVHWAHRERQDGRHSPAEVLDGVPGVARDPAALHRIFYTTRFGRTLDKLGYVRFRHWRIYGEHGLAGRRAAIWLYGETLLLEFSDEPLAQYSVAYEPDHRRLREVTPRQLFATQYRSPQLPLWELGAGEWLQVVRAPPVAHRERRHAAAEQLALPASEVS